ncbi:unnamed protein product [Adineta steineri]|nr:unnamed protein product [Adineta steineri]
MQSKIRYKCPDKTDAKALLNSGIKAPLKLDTKAQLNSGTKALLKKHDRAFGLRKAEKAGPPDWCRNNTEFANNQVDITL